MKKNIQAEGHKFNLQFINDHIIHKIRARNVLTDDTFEAKDVELIRVKKDTIINALQKRDVKSLQFKLFEVTQQEKKILILKIEVHLDFLPSFDETIHLQKIVVDKGSQQFFYEIDEINDLMKNLETNDKNYHEEKSNHYTSQNNQIWNKKLPKGNYYIQLSGICQSSPVQNQVLKFTVEVEGQEPKQLTFKTGTRSSYPYPYSLSHFVSLSHESEVRFKVKSGGNSANTILQSHHTTCVPAMSS